MSSVRRVEHEVRLGPLVDELPDPVALIGGALSRAEALHWGCISIYLDTAQRDLARLDAALSVNRAPARPRSTAWVGFKQGLGLSGIVRAASDTREYLAGDHLPDVDDVLAMSCDPVRAAVQALAPLSTRGVEVAMILVQRRQQYRLRLRDGSVLVVSDDIVSVRSPDRLQAVTSFRMREIDLSDAVGTGRILHRLVDHGPPCLLSKYALGLRILGS